MNFNIIYKDATISLIPLIFVSAMKMKYNWTRVLSLNLLLYRFLASLISLRIRLQKSEYWTRVLSLNLLSLTQVFYKGKTVNQEFLRAGLVWEDITLQPKENDFQHNHNEL
jgi:hypothetical protein